MPFAHPQQLRRFSATQPTRLMQPNRIENPGHSDLLQHAIPPAETGQIVCYKTRTYRVSPTGHPPGVDRPPVSGYARRAPQLSVLWARDGVVNAKKSTEMACTGPPKGGDPWS